MIGITVTIERDTPGGVDQYGDQIPGTVTTFDVEHCAFAPGDSLDLFGPGRDGLRVDGTLYAPHDADIRPTDRILIGADVYRIEGAPGSWSNPYSGSTPGQVIALRRAQG